MQCGGGERDSRTNQGPTAPTVSGHLSTTHQRAHADNFGSCQLDNHNSPPNTTRTACQSDFNMAATQKIAVHSLSGASLLPTIAPTHTNPHPPDLKNTTDDALPNYLHSLKFKQIHTQTDVRLALGYVAVAIAGALFYFDWKYGWDASKPYTAPAVVAYFALNGAFSYWLWFVEKGVVYEGEGKTGRVGSFSLSHSQISTVACRY
jgi:hypothetical protein